MSRYWLGIGAGALAVFGVGMTGISLGRKGLHELKTTMAGATVEALQEPIGALRFRLDGQRIGRVQSIDVQSHGEWGEKAIQMVVGLEDADLLDLVADCGITGDRIRGPREEAEFTCVDMDAAEADGLVKIGEVRFEPGSVARPLLVSRRDRRHLERSEVKQLEASLHSADGESIDGKATFDVETRHGQRQRGMVSLKAGDGRALIDIRDESGKPLFRLDAGENGVSLKAADGRGRELVRLLAGSAGVDLRIDK